MEFQEVEKKISHFISKDRIAEAIELLKEFYKNDDKLDEIILQSGRYFSAKKDQELGIIDHEELSKTSNKLRASILAFIRAEEEERGFKKKVFETSDTTEGDSMVPVFFSLGTPHKKSQIYYIEELKKCLKAYHIDLVSLDNDDWNDHDPLEPIKQKMSKCFGCITLAMERTFVQKGLNKRDSQQEGAIENQAFATPWIHIEAAIAYQLNLPFLILKDKELKSEGMLDDNIFEWRIVKIDSNNPAELDVYPVRSFIRMWVEEVKKFQHSSISD